MRTLRSTIIRNGDLTGFSVFLITEAVFALFLVACAAGAA